MNAARAVSPQQGLPVGRSETLPRARRSLRADLAGPAGQGGVEADRRLTPERPSVGFAGDHAAGERGSYRFHVISPEGTS